MTWHDVVGGVVVTLTAALVLAAFRIGYKFVLRGFVGALDRHTAEKVAPRFDQIEGRLDDQDHVLELQADALRRLEGRAQVVPFRRTHDGHG